MTIIDGKEHIEWVRELILEYTRQLNRDLSFQRLENELRNPAEKYTPRRGARCLLPSWGAVLVAAVGGAVGRNPICIIVPCHRVIGANAKLTGYNGGLHNKAALLAHERNCTMCPAP